jgi:uncharacterized protein (DUF983 family)
MSIQAPETAPARALRPLVRGGRVHCPRCSTGLLVDGADLSCIHCGYAYALDDVDSWLRGRVASARAA